MADWATANDSFEKALVSAVADSCELIERVHEHDSALTVDNFSNLCLALEKLKSSPHLAMLKSMPDQTS